MSENVVYLIASIIVVVAWGGTSAFILAYGLISDWSAGIVGRTLMSRAVSMWLLLTYALTARWLEFVPDIRSGLALGVYALIALLEWRLFLVLRAVQTGKVSAAHPEYQPVRDLIRRHRARRTER